VADTTSARPADLAAYVVTIRARITQIETEVATARTAFNTFANSPGADAEAGKATMGTSTDALLDRLRGLADYVDIVHDALLLADNSGSDTITVDNSTLEGHVADLAVQRGTTYEELMATDVDLTVPLPEVGTIPADSGYVDDPICTATGHLLIPVSDFPMPPRLELLTWERTYSSVGDLDNVGLGTGWSSLLNARGVRSGPDWSITDHHSRTIRLAPSNGDDGNDATDSWTSTDGNVTARIDDGRIVVRWGRRSTHPYQRWAFDTVSGNLTEVVAAALGRTAFHYDGVRLVAMVHQGGRRLDLDWEGGRVVALTSSDGRRVDYHWADDRLIGSTGPGCTERYEYDKHGNIIAIVDADGVVLAQSEFDDAGRVTLQHTNYGGTSQFAYERGHRTVVSDGDGIRRSGFLHDDKGRVILATGDPLLPLSRRFDDAGRIVEQINLDGTRFTNDVTVDPATGASTETLRHSNGSVEIFQYDEHERILRYARDGQATTYVYDDARDIDALDGSTELPSQIAADGGWTLDLTWDDGVLVRTVDADGVRIDLVNDADGMVVQTIEGTGDVTRFVPHSAGSYGRVEYADGATERYTFDDAGRLLSAISPTGATTVIEMTAAGRLVSLTDPTGASTRCTHDDRGRLTAIVDATGAACLVEQDVDGRPRRIELPDGSTYTIERDTAGRVVGATATHPGIETRTWTSTRHDAAGLVEMVSPGGRVTSFAHLEGAVATWAATAGGASTDSVYDRLAQQHITTDDAGRTWSVSASEDGRQITSLDPAGTVTTSEYSPAGRLRSIRTDNTALELSYDECGRVIGRDEGRGMWEYGRDVRGRVVELTSPEGRTRRWEYDLSGRIVVEHDGAQRTTSSYDLAGRLIATTTADGRTRRHTYGPRGELMETIDSGGGVTRYRYDDLRRVIAVVDPAGGETTLTYAFERNVAAMTDPNGRVTSYQTDLDGRLVAVIDDDGNESTLERDERGRCIAIVSRGERTAIAPDSTLDDASPPSLPDEPWATVQRDADGLLVALRAAGFLRTVSRDDVGRIMETVDQHDDGTISKSVERDTAGRIIEQRQNDATTTYTYDEAGFLSTLRGAQDVDWTFDALGRMVTENVDGDERRYDYDGAGQLLSVDGAAGATTFEYDAMGRRIASAGARAVQYEWGVGGLASIATPAGTTVFHRDAFGLVDSVSGSDGETTIEWDHQAMPPMPITIDGRRVVNDGFAAIGVLSDDGASFETFDRLVEPWGRTNLADGKSADTETVRWHPFHGLRIGDHVVLGSRVYDIETRQFISRDPDVAQIGPAGAQWTYCYAHNDPANLFDPLGLSPLSVDEFERIKDRYTGIQWGNVALVAVVVAAALLAPTGAGAMVLVAYGAGAGLATEATQQGVNYVTERGDEGFDGGAIVKATVVGGLTGPLATIPGGSTVTSRLTINFLSGAAGSTVEETYDVLPLPGADGSFDPANLLVGGVTDAGLGELTHHVDIMRGSATPSPDPTPAAPTAANPVATITAPTAAPPVNRQGLPTPDPIPTITIPQAPGPVHGPTAPGPMHGPSLPGPVHGPPVPTIKGNRDSMIFHTPDSPWYGRTIAEEMFHTPEAAAAAGYRAPGGG